MRDLSINETVIIEGWVSSTLFGINLVLYFLCARVLSGRANGWSSHRWLLVVATLQIAISGSHAGVFLAKIKHAFITLDTAAQATEYLSMQGAPLHVTEEALYVMNDIIGSGVLVWRCYVIHQRNWIVGLALLLPWLGTITSGLGGVYICAQLPPGLDGVYSPVLAKWILAFTSLSLITQLSSTSLIAWKIWSTMSWRSKPDVGTHQWALLRIIVESCAIYSLGTILSLIFFELQVTSGSIDVAILAQISATAPFLMIVRADAEFSNRTSERTKDDLTSVNGTAFLSTYHLGPSVSHMSSAPDFESRLDDSQLTQSVEYIEKNLDKLAKEV